MSNPIRICVAGVTGWTGSAVARAIVSGPRSELALTGAVARRAAGRDAGEALGMEPCGLRVVATVGEALKGSDVLIDYTRPDAVKEHVLEALSRGVNVVVGTSGLTAADYREIEAAALAAGRGVVAAGNFSITAALAKHFALIAARHLPHREVIEYTHAEKPDVPSGTVRELAEALAAVRPNELEFPIDRLRGPREARGAQIEGTPVHSVRLPSYVIAFETQFGLPDERLTIRHDAGSGAEPYVAGTLLAARRAAALKGLVRGLDTLLFGA